jgi:hypothetical protein
LDYKCGPHICFMWCWALTPGARVLGWLWANWATFLVPAPPPPNFLLGIYFIYISNVILKVPYMFPPPHSPAPLLTHSHFLALVFPCTGAYNLHKTKGPPFPVMAD